MGENGLRGSRVGSRLFRDLGGRRRRPAAVVAGDGGACVEIRGASSLGPVEAGERPSEMECLPKVAESLRAEGSLRWNGPHAPCPNTVKRRLAGWSTLHRWKGIEGPFAAPSLRSALRLAV
jgi:hypothetical protein